MVVFKSHKGPEDKIAEACDGFLAARGWLVESMHGNLFQRGIPDRYVAHLKHGSRWIDYKNPERYSFTTAQRKKWPMWERFQVDIWILTAATESEYAKLFGPPNWREFWKSSYDNLPNLESLLIRLENENDS